LVNDIETIFFIDDQVRAQRHLRAIIQQPFQSID
jgi:hypothetical protein